MIEIFDKSRKKVAILENAYGVTEREEINSVASLTFSLPDTDDKNQYCQPFHFVRHDGGQLYRIMAPAGTRSDTGSITYECEHVIATLIDDVLFGAHVVGNLGVYTRDSIQYVLDRQTETRWVLGECDFSRQFEYGWENENLLAALFSIPNRFVDPYMWTYDTSVFPWVVNLKLIDEGAKPQFYIRAGKNLLQRDFTSAAQDVCTRLYCLGYGEGVNQLTIADVNGGLPYLQSPQEYIDKYGLISRIWVDRRFEDAASLMERGQAILSELQDPRLSVTVSAADLYQMTQADYDKAEIGRITLLADDNIKTYITGITRNWDTPGDMQLTLATKPVDVASSIADLADRQRIEQVYSQGATQLYGQSVQANATPDIGAVLNFWIPDEMRIINKVLAKITLDRFRSYSRSTSGGGATTSTSSSGGGGTSTSSSGGGTYSSTAVDGGSTQTSESSSRSTSGSGGDYSDSLRTGGASTSGYSGYFSQTGTTESHTHGVPNHYHAMTVSIPNHSHGISHTHRVSIPSHSHSFQVGAHTHSVSIPSHTHSVSIPNHTHGIEQGIFEFGGASGATIWVNGKEKGAMGTDHDVDLTAWLLNEDGKIDRGRWHKVAIVPDDLAYVTIDIYIQGFVQSRGGSTY